MGPRRLRHPRGIRAAAPLLEPLRCQWWNPMISAGARGLRARSHRRAAREHEGGHGSECALVVLWGESREPAEYGRYLTAAKRRGAYVSPSTCGAPSLRAVDETLLIARHRRRACPGMMHVIVAERRHDSAFVARHTLGFDALAPHLSEHDVAWAAATTGVEGERIASSRAATRARTAMILLGGSSMHKGAQGWQGARAVACLPALTGNFGIRAVVWGHDTAPRRMAGSLEHCRARSAPARRLRPQSDAANHRGARRRARARADVVRHRHAVLVRRRGRVGGRSSGSRCSPLRSLMHDTARRYADVILPATAWLEDTGCKSTNTHLYLMPKRWSRSEARPPTWVLRELARRLDVHDFFPWQDDSGPLDAILDHPATGTRRPPRSRPKAHPAAARLARCLSDLKFDTPSGNIEFFSGRAARLGLPRCPCSRARRGRNIARAAQRSHSYAVPRLLRSRPGVAHPRRGRPGAATLDLV